MDEYIQEITFDQARSIAEESAVRIVEPFMDSSSIPVLHEQVEESDCCWFFFRNKQIEGPPERVLGWHFALAVSKKGVVSIIADFSDEPKKLQEYLQAMSNYFKERGL